MIVISNTDSAFDCTPKAYNIIVRRTHRESPVSCEELPAIRNLPILGFACGLWASFHELNQWSLEVSELNIR